MLATTDAKEKFKLKTSDIEGIQGYRRYEYSPLTLYYIDDLAAVSLAKHGENYSNNHVPAGRVIAGAPAKQAQKQAHPYFFTLDLLDVIRLRHMLVRYEGVQKKYNYKTNKKNCIVRIIAAGYSVENETAYMNQQKREAEAARKGE